VAGVPAIREPVPGCLTGMQIKDTGGIRIAGPGPPLRRDRDQLHRQG